MTADLLIPDVLPVPPAPVAVAPVGTGGLLDALMKHYRKPGAPRDGVVLITEPEAPGRSLRRADLIAIGVGSRGHWIDGHELKVSRSDWLRELDDPEKADAWWPHCTRWWIVAPPDIVRPDELPEGWGLMIPPSRGRRFRVVVPAAAKEPQITLPLLIALMRRADNERLRTAQQLEEKHRNDLFKQAEAIRREQDRRQLSPHHKGRLELLDKIESALGVRIDQYAWYGDATVRDVRPEELAAALAGVPGHVEAQRLLKRAEQVRDDLTRAANTALRTLRGHE